MSDARPAVTNLQLAELEQLLAASGERPFRARQLVKWVYGKGATGFDRMTDLAAPLRESLPKLLRLRSTEIAENRLSADGTRKLLLRLSGGDAIETVLIPEGDRRTLCISTQAGCPVGCVFCASGIGGLSRNLTQGEIVEQILQMRAAAEGEPLTNIVLMGIGEPLLNYDAVTRALRVMRAPWGFNFGYNKITLSTVGIVDKIHRLLEDGVTPNLAISLHAPNDDLRRRLIPNVRKWSMTELIQAGVIYRDKARKDVTFEYVLLEGINDDPAHAAQLGKLLAGQRIKVNVIPFNRVREFSYHPPSKERLDKFVRALGSFKVFTSVRKRRGDSIDAACGQLRLTSRLSQVVNP
ncbi:MAG TPA: 23S rRNA (adenine(2503)-C(2))-methyltransferase RlmN [Planctomycetota bacterium]|nr:23S rRNA (adenine(2503)-C(2))-methyltransferase RlmN [Planctomycetota bacterium]